jgi:hypothetical protein
MKRNFVVLFGVLVFIALIVGTFLVAGADDGLPDGVLVFTVGGKYCLWDEEGRHLLQPCWCKDECGGDVDVCEQNPTPTDEPKRDPTKTPIVPDPTNTPRSPTPTQPPEPTDTPKPDKVSCNRGLGNGPEDCDPGNSGGKPGKAGEDDG